MRLTDKRIVITGSTTGIGRAMARTFVREGAMVLIHGRNLQAAEKLSAELGHRASLCVADLSDQEASHQISRAAIKQLGHIDALVNNAAWTGRSNIDSTTPPVLQHCLQVNVQAPLSLIQSMLPHLAKSRGCVLNIGSVNAWCGEPDLLAYSISKGALATMTRNLGDSLHRDHGVRVNQFNLGWVLTENEDRLKRADGLPADWSNQLDRFVAPSGRIMTPEEVASIAIGWVCGESHPVSGSVMDLEQYPVLGRNPPKEVDERS